MSHNIIQTLYSTLFPDQRDKEWRDISGGVKIYSHKGLVVQYSALRLAAGCGAFKM